jgi:hypothetical protein
MSQINVDIIRSRTGTAATCDKGVVVSGTCTATTFSGALTGDVTGNVTGNATGLSGTPSITVDNIIAVGATFSGTVSYEDIKNLDSVGIVTARAGLQVGPLTGIAATIDIGGNFDGGIVTATTYYGSGANLTGVISGVDVKSGGSFLGAGVTDINFSEGATVTVSGAGATIAISAGISTEAKTSTTASAAQIDISAYQDHKVTCTGITTIDCTGSATEGNSHTLRIVNSGIATVGFSTYFLWPQGAAPVLTTTDGAISQISFTVHRSSGGTGIATQLLSGASINYS